MVNPFLYGPAGYAALPLAVQLVSDIAQARMRAASEVAGSVANVVGALTGVVAGQPGIFAGQPSEAYRYQPYSYPYTAPQWRRDDVQSATSRAWRPTNFNVVEGDESYLAHIEIPNVDPQDVSVRVERNQVEVSGRPRADGSDNIRASIAIPDGVDRENITAEYREGILHLRLPKGAKQMRREVKVQT